MPADNLQLALPEPQDSARRVALGQGAVLLRGLAAERSPALLRALAEIEEAAPFRHMVTPGGRAMSVAMTNCGEVGWVADRTGYRYAPLDPDTGRPWPPIPNMFAALAIEAAALAGYCDFQPDVCLVNRYVPGARLSLHQDRNERDFAQPIVSVSLGLPALFLWGGKTRLDRPTRTALLHGDVVVWGGPDRLNFHGVNPLAEGFHPLAGAARYNLTFRRAR